MVNRDFILVSVVISFFILVFLVLSYLTVPFGTQYDCLKEFASDFCESQGKALHKNLIPVTYNSFLCEYHTSPFNERVEVSSFKTDFFYFTTEEKKECASYG